MAFLYGLLLASLFLANPAATPGNQVLVVIDPGHGGIDGGTQNVEGTVLEKDLNLRIAKLLAQRLQQRGVRVAMTRTADEDVTRHAPDERGWSRHKRDLYGRVEFSRKKNATVLISIHGNHGRETNRGAIVFYKPESLESFLLASELQSRLNELTGSFHSPEKGSRYYVIKKPAIPSVLVEYGYLSNPRELNRLLDATYQEKMADTLADGLCYFLIFYHEPR